MSEAGATPIAFFRSMQQAFGSILANASHDPRLVDTLTLKAFDLFEENIKIQTEGLPPIACHKGCPSCCTLRITATAPEILLLSHYIRQIHATAAGARLDLPGRVAEASLATAGLDEQARFKLRRLCPLIFRGVCVVHPVRPLACRGHASFDKRACARVASGRDMDVPVSEPHSLMRSLVQNALQASLREAGLAWRAYELNAGLELALTDSSCLATWMTGGDALRPALLTDVDWPAMADVFDAILMDGTRAQ